MYAITGATGKVGGALARRLLDAGLPVRVVVRDASKGAAWSAAGAQVAVASSDDADALAAAFADCAGVFLMNPPNFDPEPGFPDTRATAATFAQALEQAEPGRAVLLSTVGAHAVKPNLLNNMLIVESALRSSSVPLAYLRAGWFMENAACDVEAARAGEVPAFLQPTDHAIPMVATADIADAAHALLLAAWRGVRVVELEGPARYSADDVARAFAGALERPVHARGVPRETWESLFRAQGMRHPEPRMRMLDGFNEGWIDFEGGSAEHRRGSTALDAVIRQLVDA